MLLFFLYSTTGQSDNFYKNHSIIGKYLAKPLTIRIILTNLVANVSVQVYDLLMKIRNSVIEADHDEIDIDPVVDYIISHGIETAVILEAFLLAADGVILPKDGAGRGFEVQINEKNYGAKNLGLLFSKIEERKSQIRTEQQTERQYEALKRTQPY